MTVNQRQMANAIRALAMDAIQAAIKDGKLNSAEIEKTHARVLNLKQKNISNPDPLELAAALKIIGNAEHIKLSDAIKEGVVPQGLIIAD